MMCGVKGGSGVTVRLTKEEIRMGNQNEVRKNFGQRASEYRLSSTHGNPEDLERMINLIKPTSDDIEGQVGG